MDALVLSANSQLLNPICILNFAHISYLGVLIAFSFGYHYLGSALTDSELNNSMAALNSICLHARGCSTFKTNLSCYISCSILLCCLFLDKSFRSYKTSIFPGLLEPDCKPLCIE